MKDSGTSLEKKLDVAISMLQHMLALELAREGVSQQANLRLATAGVNKMLKGTKRHGE
jgi:hypothetical protein